MTTSYDQLLKDYDSLQEKFQKLWFENHQIKDMNLELQDKIEALEEILRFDQDFK